MNKRLVILQWGEGIFQKCWPSIQFLKIGSYIHQHFSISHLVQGKRTYQEYSHLVLIEFPCCSYTFIKENVLYHRVNFLYHRVNISRRQDCLSLNFIYVFVIFRIINSKNDFKYYLIVYNNYRVFHLL